MGERTFDIEPYGVAYDCDECGEEMTRDDRHGMRMTAPPQVANSCPNGHIKWLAEGYPTVRWRRPAPAPDKEG